MLHRKKIMAMFICLLLPHQSRADDMSWLTFLEITALTTGTTLGLTYLGADFIFTHFARKVGDEMNKELRKTVQELKNDRANGLQEQKYGHLVRERSITLNDYINPPKEITTLLKQLKNPKRYESMGLSIPRGILLVGDPGVGKTYLARALAGELDSPFFEYSAPEFSKIHIGEAGIAIRNAFTEARNYAKENGKNLAILFVDEFDAIGNRSEQHSVSTAEQVNTFLTCMDGFAKQQPPVIVIASTNHVEKIDDALKRKGRFDSIVYIPYPDKDTRRKLFLQKMNKTKVDSRIINNLDNKLAALTEGFSHADVGALINKSAEIAIEKNVDGSGINYDCLVHALWHTRKEKYSQKLPLRSLKKEILNQYSLLYNINDLSEEEFLADVDDMQLPDIKDIFEESYDSHKKNRLDINSSIKYVLSNKKQQRKIQKNKQASEICEQLYPSAEQFTEDDLLKKTPEDIFEANLKKHSRTR